MPKKREDRRTDTDRQKEREREREIEEGEKIKEKSNPSQGSAPPTTETATSIRNHIFFRPTLAALGISHRKFHEGRERGMRTDEKKERRGKKKEETLQRVER